MLRWCTIYKGEPQVERCTDEPTPRAAVAQRFQDAKRLGMHDGRAVLGMWLIEGTTQQEDVIEVYGRVPVPIQIRYAAYMASTKPKPRR